jgi:biotin transport system substrate-specific component
VWQVRLLRIALFVVLTALSARFRIDLPGTPVPITGQVFVVLLAGMALGAREGAASQITYLALILAGAPIDSRGLGAAAFVGPTAGYLVAFVPAAFIAGLAVRRAVAWNVMAGLVAVAVIHAIGTLGVAIYAKVPWSTASLLGSAPFILLDFGKALLAASLVKLEKESLTRWGWQ